MQIANHQRDKLDLSIWQNMLHYKTELIDMNDAVLLFLFEVEF